MYLVVEEVKKILAIMEEFPEAKSFELKSDRSSGIGAILTLTMEMELKGHPTSVTVEISGVENW